MLKEEQFRIVLTLTMVVAENIRSQVYKYTQYPLLGEFLKANESFIPETLKIFRDAAF